MPNDYCAVAAVIIYRYRPVAPVFLTQDHYEKISVYSLSGHAAVRGWMI